MNPQNTSDEQQNNNQQGLLNKSGIIQQTYSQNPSQQKVSKRGLLLTVMAMAVPLILIAYYLASFYSSGKPYDLGSNIKYVKTSQTHGCPIFCDSSGVTTSYYYVTTLPYELPAEGWYDPLTTSQNNRILFSQITTALKEDGFRVKPKDKGVSVDLPSFVNQKGNYLNVNIGPNSDFYGTDAISPSAIQKYCSKNCNVIELDYFH